MASSPITSWQIDRQIGEKVETVTFYFGGLQNHCEQQWLQLWNLKTLAPWKKCYDKPRQHIKKQRHHFVDKSPSSQSYGFFSSHVWMWELDHKEGQILKNWCFWIVLLKTLESPLDCKEIKPVSAKQNQPWVFIERTLAEALILWQLIWRDSLEKTPMLGKTEDKRRRGRQRMRWLDNITDSMNMNLSKLREIVKNREAWHAAVHRVTYLDMT